MPDTEDAAVEQARNDAFRRIGRNVYFFQLIEAALKHLVVHGDVEGYVSDLPKLVADRTRTVAKQPMGNLVDSFVKNIYQGHSEARGEPADLNAAWVSIRFRVEADDAFVRARKHALKVIVKERNDLVHRQLPGIAPNDAEKLRQLSEFLDAQRGRLTVEFEGLRTMIRSLNEVRNEAWRELDSALTAAVSGSESGA